MASVQDSESEQLVDSAVDSDDDCTDCEAATEKADDCFTPIISNETGDEILADPYRKNRLTFVSFCALGIALVGSGWVLFHGRGQKRYTDLVDGSLETDNHQNAIPHRIFKPWGDKPFPCPEITPENRSFEEGIFYTKVPKTASSTLAGVGLRIAHRQGAKYLSKPGAMCNVNVGHGDVREDFHYALRDPEKSFLWSVVRDPPRHIVSAYFYSHISRQGHKASVKDFKSWVDHFAKDNKGTFQLDVMRLRDYNTTDETVRGVLQDYDFIGVTERLDESLVVLQMILGLDVGDILYLSAKRSGGYAYVTSHNNPRCVYEHPKELNPDDVKNITGTDEWREHFKGDILLYQAVNTSLDATIDNLGRTGFEEKLRIYRKALATAQERCEERTVFPCDSEGKMHKHTDCYKRDWGCGYACLDEVASTLPSPNVAE